MLFPAMVCERERERVSRQARLSTHCCVDLAERAAVRDWSLSATTRGSLLLGLLRPLEARMADSAVEIWWHMEPISSNSVTFPHTSAAVLICIVVSAPCFVSLSALVSKQSGSSPTRLHHVSGVHP